MWFMVSRFKGQTQKMRIEINTWIASHVGLWMFQRSNSENEDWNSLKRLTQLLQPQFQRSNSENEDWNSILKFGASRTRIVSKVKLRKWGLKYANSERWFWAPHLVSKVKLRKWGLKWAKRVGESDEDPVSKVKLRKWGLKYIQSDQQNIDMSCFKGQTQKMRIEISMLLVFLKDLPAFARFQRSNSENEDWNANPLYFVVPSPACFKGQTQKMRIEIPFLWCYAFCIGLFQRSNSKNEMIWKTTFIGIVTGGVYRLGPFSILAHT